MDPRITVLLFSFHHFRLSLSVPEDLRMSSSEYKCMPFLTEAAAYLAAFGDALVPNMLVKVAERVASLVAVSLLWMYSVVLFIQVLFQLSLLVAPGYQHPQNFWLLQFQ